MADPVMALVALWGLLGRLADLAGAALAFEAAAFAFVATDGFGRAMALVIVFFAGVSTTLGESLVLFLNRVRPWRFVLSLALTGAVYLANVLATAVTVKAGAFLLADARLDLAAIVGVQALAYAPRLMGVLVLMPYAGQALSRLLDLWTLALTVFGLRVGLDIHLVLAAGAALGGWMLMQLLLMLFGAPLTALMQRLRRLVSGSALDLDPSDVAASLARKARDLVGGDRR